MLTTWDFGNAYSEPAARTTRTSASDTLCVPSAGQEAQSCAVSRMMVRFA